MTRLLRAVVSLWLLTCTTEALAGQPAPYVGHLAGFAVSQPARSLTVEKPSEAEARPEDFERENHELPRRSGVGKFETRDALVEEPNAPAVMPGPSLSFDGLSFANNVAAFGFGVLPPDTNGDVGPNHYVQMANLLVRIFDKTGTPVTAPFKLSSLFSALPGPCSSKDSGDPIVVYDPLADRWLLSQFCIVADPNYHQMIAISKTPDPTGQYYLYDFVMPNEKFNDYPHFGVWPDAYYMTVNQFVGDTWGGAGAFAFDRAKMLVGDPTATYVYFDEFGINSDIGGQLPTDLDGLAAPPPGTPNLFLSFLADEFGDPIDGLRVFEFRPNFANPPLSTFLARPNVAFSSYDARSPLSRDAVEQPAPATSSSYLDAIADRLMHRVAYRVLPGGAQSYVLNFTVNVSGSNPTASSTYQAGVRWTELRRSAAGAITVANQGTFAPGSGNGATGENRWMGSIAQDNQGNIALGYSVSATATFPSIRWAGRLAGDAANTLAQGEASVIAGTGSQTHSASRWGDYSAMSVDPADDCTFWYTQEYYTLAGQNAGAASWSTRIASFKYPSCPASGRGTIQGTITNCLGGGPLADARVILAEGFFRATGASGGYSMTLAPGTYQVSVSKPGFATTGTTLTVTAGGAATFDACLTPAALVTTSPSGLAAESCSVNGSIEPGETVTASLCVQNTGGAATGSVTGTLQASGGVTAPSAPQGYGVLPAGGGSVCRNFTFTAGGVCGGLLTITLQLQDGSTPIGAVRYSTIEGALVTPLNESFDSVTAPNLPGSWTASNATGPAPLWTTSAVSPDSGPNDAFVDDPQFIADKRLDTPVFAIASPSAQLTFRNSFDFDWDGDLFYDGGVLEIKIGAGAFTDILAAGGSFVSGGYNATLETAFGNPLSGRKAWSGPSLGYETTIVNLPASAAGQNVQFRFRMGSDNLFGAPGWRIDGVTVKDRSCCATPQAQALLVDAHAGPLPTSSNLDGVFAPGETIQVEPSWRNNGTTTLPLTGTGSLFTGPAGATYTFNDPAAAYGSLPAGSIGSCFAAGNCYQMTVSNPVSRPATHWDSTYTETLSTGTSRTFTLHIGSSFTDVAPSYLFYPQIEALLHNNVTTGCAAAAYCPDDPVTRLQMAIFLARAIARGDLAVAATGVAGVEPYACVAGGLSLFSDVPATDPFCRHVHYILSRGATTGCAPGQYCPASNVTRSQMGMFVARSVTGSDASVPLAYGPDPVTGLSYNCDPASPNTHFSDVSTADFFCRHLEYLRARGIVNGFPDGTYGPNLNVTRGQMAKFLVNGFGLKLYSP